jgi:tRNA U34 2-thiouridine synthase MnmA/TrmU
MLHIKTAASQCFARNVGDDACYVAAPSVMLFCAAHQQTQLLLRCGILATAGHLIKADVRSIAAAAQLPMADKRSSAGICFIGRRSFGRFLEDYLTPKPGVYVDVESGRQLGTCANMLAVTVGQRAVGLGGQQQRVYVAGKDLAAGVVHLAQGREHPALYSSRVLLLPPNWIGTAPQPAGYDAAIASSSSSSCGGLIRCSYRARYRQPAAACSVRPLLLGEQFAVSRYCGGLQEGLTTSTAAAAGAKVQQEMPAHHAASAAAGMHRAWPAAAVTAAAVQQQQGLQQQGLWVAELAEPLRGITPGQMFVLSDGQVCLGSAMIAAHGPTMAEQQ